MPFILQTSGLSKKIGSKALVTDVNIHIPKGEIYGFLGPNGAGKTTVMKMITNLWKPTSGTIEVFGEVLTPKSYEVLKRMGCIIEFPTFYDHMTGRENLQLHCEYMGYYNVDSVESALQMLDLTSAADPQHKDGESLKCCNGIVIAGEFCVAVCGIAQHQQPIIGVPNKNRVILNISF